MHLKTIDSRFLTFLLLALALVAFGCGGGAAEDEHADMDHSEMDHSEMEEAEESTGPSIYFADLNDGDTVTSPLRLTLGADNFTIEPVGDGAIHEGAGHFHVGVGEHCLPPGTVIPPGTPNWIHFGDGSSVIEIQLDPGMHHLSLQAGDGEHRTLDAPGLCQMVTIEVIQEGV